MKHKGENSLAKKVFWGMVIFSVILLTWIALTVKDSYTYNNNLDIAKKYKIYYSAKKKAKYKLYITTQKTKVTTSKKLKAKKTYYFKVAAVDKNGMIGKESKVKRVKVNK